MRFIFKFDKVNIIQLFIILMIVVRGNTRYFAGGYFEGKNFYDCVFVGTHQTTSGSKCEESKVEKVLKKPEKQLPFSWKLEIEDLVEYSTGNETLEQYHITCNAILISNKHALVAASCVLRGHDIVDLRKEKPDIIRRGNKRILLPTGKSVSIFKLFVHNNYSKSTHDFDISILEFENVVRMDRSNIYPAILPQAPLAFHHGNQLHVAIVKSKSEKYLERVNASVWSKEECSPNDEHLMCIETDTNCDDLVQPNTFPKRSISPIFHVVEWSENSNAKMEILGIPMGCKRIDSPISKSALVYLRVADFLPWIENIIFNGGAKCVDETPNIRDAVVFEGENPHPEGLYDMWVTIAERIVW